MTKLIQSLKNDHRVIITLLNKSNNRNLTINERSAFLLTVKCLLTEHFNKEHRELYPVLMNNSNEDDITETAGNFMNGLQSIGRIIDNFFIHNENNLDNLQTDSDFPKTLKLLESRIKKEEKELYPLYDSIVK
jgi:Hemerythrin HHE cation binding domain